MSSFPVQLPWNWNSCLIHLFLPRDEDDDDLSFSSINCIVDPRQPPRCVRSVLIIRLRKGEEEEQVEDQNYYFIDLQHLAMSVIMQRRSMILSHIIILRPFGI